MNEKQRKPLLRLMFMTPILVLMVGFMSTAKAEEPFSKKMVAKYRSGTKADYLAGAHTKMGLACSSCHHQAKTDDSEYKINATCTGCHGELSAIAQKNKGHINPHKSHLGKINCTACHAGHEASVAYCSNCHSFSEMKIPYNNGAKPKSQRDDWKAYDKVKPSHIEKTDILVIGSGAAGFTAALSAYEHGVRVIIVEKMPIPGGNSQLAAGGMNAAGTPFQAQQGIKDNPELMTQDTMKGGKNINNPELVRILAEQSAESIKWLAERGAVLDNIGRGAGANATRMHGPSGGAFVGPYLSAFFRKQVSDKNIDLRLNSKAIKLVTDKSGAVTGAIVKGKHSGFYQINAKAVILATGGFGANPDMVAKYRPELRNTATSNQPGTQGDGIRMSEAVGAEMVDLKEIQVNPTLLVGTPVIVSEIVRGAGAIFVNREAKRFISELKTRDVTSAAIFKQTGGSVFEIFDRKVFEKVKQLSAAAELNKLYQADTVTGLAKEIGVAPQTLEATINRYNSFVDAKSDADFGRADLPLRIDAPKYYAIEVKPAIHYSMGGTKFNTKGQVLNVKGEPIKGLYAAGEVTGGVHGANRLGGNSISETITFGRIAGNSAAKSIR